jgi:hypothetical protein
MTDTKKTYQFCVPCSYYYEIEANTEEEARQILIEKGGIIIEGELLIEADDYKQADCIGEMQ